MSTPAVPRPTLDDLLREREELEALLKKEKKKRKKAEQKQQQGPGSARGIETMFRTTYQTHNDLVALADNKANMMISVNGIIISILLASLSPRLGETGWVLIPTGMLLLGCVGSLVFGVLAARPRVTRNVAALADAETRRPNLLFFGDFLRLSQTEYVTEMGKLMTNSEDVYVTMVRNLYALGNILEKKFRLLWLSYTLFLAGLGLAVVVSVAMFVRWMMIGPVEVVP